MGKREGRRKTREVKEHAQRVNRKEEREKSERKKKFESPSDPAEGIYVTYEMMSPDTKMVVDRIFRDRRRAEYIANL